jgi:hypothetical protein
VQLPAAPPHTTGAIGLRTPASDAPALGRPTGSARRRRRPPGW